MFRGVFIAEVDGVADKRSGDTAMVDVLTEGLSEHVPEIYLFHRQSFSLVNRKISDPGITLLKCWIIRISKLSEFPIMPKDI